MQSENQSNSGHSQQSSHTFLTVPRVIALGQNEPNGTKNVTFKNPKEIQQSENHESLEESQFSKQSHDKRSLRGSPQSISDQVQVEEPYDKLKKFQTEMEKLVSQKKVMIGRNRGISIEDSKHNLSQFSKLDSFKPTPSFQGNQVAQIIKVRTFGQQTPENSDFQDKLIQSVDREDPKKESYIEQVNIPLIPDKEKQEKRVVKFKSYWSNKIIILIRALGKLNNPYRVYDDFYRLKHFTRYLFRIINDNASSFKVFSIPSIKPKKQKISLNGILLNPECLFRKYWNLFILIIYVLSIIIIPLQMSIYKDQLQIDFTTITDLQELYTYQIFSLISLQKYKQMALLQMIPQLYLKDIQVIIPFSILMSYYSHFLIGLIVILRVNTIMKYWSQLAEILDLNKIIETILKLIIFIFLCGHYTACLWYYIGQQESISWMSNLSLEEIPLGFRYIKCLYFSITWLSSISNYSIQPVTQIETIVSIFQSILSVVFISFIINEVNMLLNYRKDSHYEKYRQAVRYFKTRHLSKPLFQNLKYKLQYQILNKKDSKNENVYISKLDQKFQEEIKIDLYQKVQIFMLQQLQYLESSPLIKNHCSQQCIQQLCSHIVLQKTKAGEILLNKGDLCDKLFFLLEGKIKSYIKINQQLVVLSEILPGQIVFEKEFILNQQSPSTLKCESECTIIYLHFKTFNETVHSHQEEFERIRMYHENMIYNQHYQLTKQFCQICSQNNHSMRQCPFIFYIPNRRLLIKEHNRVVMNIRKKSHYRNISNRFNTRINQNLISILGIGFGVREGLLRDSELTNEMMNKLKGSNQNFEDSLFLEQDDRTSRQTLLDKLDKQYTYTYTQKNPTDMQLVQPQQTSLSSGQSQQQQTTPVEKQILIQFKQNLPRMETVNEKESIYGSIGQQTLQYLQFSERNQTSVSSIKVNVFRSNLSTDQPQFQQQQQQRTSNDRISQQQRIPSSKRGTTSTGSMNNERQVRPKLTTISANIQKQQTQNSTHQPILNQSTSILHQGFQKSMTSIPQNSSQSPSPPIFDDPDNPFPFSDSSNNALNQGFFAHNSRFRLQMEDFDRMHIFTIYFRNYNIDQISKRMNLIATIQVQKNKMNQINNQQEIDDKDKNNFQQRNQQLEQLQQDQIVYPLRPFKKSLTEIPVSNQFYK